MQSCLPSRPEAASADVLIAPAIALAGVDEAEGRETARRLGYDAARDALPALWTALQHHGVAPRAGTGRTGGPRAFAFDGALTPGSLAGTDCRMGGTWCK